MVTGPKVRIASLIVPHLVFLIQNVLNTIRIVVMHTSWTVLNVSILFSRSTKSVEISKRSPIKILKVKLSLITKMHQNILLNGHVTIFALLDKMLRRSPSSHRWAKTRLFVHSTRVKKSCLKTTEKLKVHTLEKEVCLCWSDHSF